MKNVILIICFISFSYQLNSQGFDWQYSPRLPVVYPNLYAGINFNYSYYLHKGEFDFLLSDFTCCTYTDGAGSYPKAGLSLEYWYKPDIALNADINYRIINSGFSETKPEQRQDLEVIRRFTSNINIHYLFINLGTRYRIMNSHFSIGGSAGLGFLTANIEEHYEESLTPEVPLDNVPGLYKKELELGIIPEPKSFLFYPSVSFGYDLNLGRGLYATPNINMLIPLYSMINNNEGKWYPWSVSIGVTVLRGFRVAGL